MKARIWLKVQKLCTNYHSLGFLEGRLKKKRKKEKKQCLPCINFDAFTSTLFSVRTDFPFHPWMNRDGWAPEELGYLFLRLEWGQGPAAFIQWLSQDHQHTHTKKKLPDIMAKLGTQPFLKVRKTWVTQSKLLGRGGQASRWSAWKSKGVKESFKLHRFGGSCRVGTRRHMSQTSNSSCVKFRH